MREWVSTSVRYPRLYSHGYSIYGSELWESSDVLVCFTSGIEKVCRLRVRQFIEEKTTLLTWWDMHHEYSQGEISYWMGLPSPPSDYNNGEDVYGDLIYSDLDYDKECIWEGDICG